MACRGRCWTIPSSRSSLVGVLDTVLTTGLHGRSVVREEVPEQAMSKTVSRRGDDKVVFGERGPREPMLQLW